MDTPVETTVWQSPPAENQLGLPKRNVWQAMWRGFRCRCPQCGEGKLCAPAEWLPECTGDSCCTEWCDLSAPACATPGTVCEPYLVWNHQGDPGFDDLGACVQPGALR